MAFDPSLGKPVSSGFDPSKGKPVSQPTQQKSLLKRFLGGAEGYGDAIVGGYNYMANDPVVKAVGSVPGYAAAGLGAVVGGVTGGAAKFLSNIVQQKKLFEGVREQAIKSAHETADLGYQSGSTAVTAVPFIAPGVAAGAVGGPALGAAAAATNVVNLAGSAGLATHGAFGEAEAIKEKDVVKGITSGLEIVGGILGMLHSGKVLKQDLSAAKNKITGASAKIDAALQEQAAKITERINAASELGDDGLPKGKIDRIIYNAKQAMDERRALAAETPERKLLLERGFAKPDVERMISSNPGDLAKYKKMFDIEVANRTNPRVTARAIDEVGSTVAEKVNMIHDVRSQVGQQLDDAANAMPDKPIDYSAVTSELDDNLAKLNVHSMVDNPNKLDFSDSVLATDKTSQKLFQQLYNKLQPGEMTPTEARTLRQQMFNTMKLATKPNGPGAMSGQGEAILEGFRDQIDEPLKAMSPQYAAAAKTYAQTSDTLRDFYKAIGKDWTGNETKFNARLGEWANRVLGNASARPAEVLDAIESLADDLGYKGNMSITDQVKFVDMLDDMLGTTQTRSLQGNIERAGTNILANAATQGGGVVSKTIGAAKNAALEAMQVTPAERASALGRFLDILIKNQDAGQKTILPTAAVPTAPTPADAIPFTKLQATPAASLKPGLVIKDFPFDGVKAQAQLVSVDGALKAVPMSIVNEAVRSAEEAIATQGVPVEQAMKAAADLMKSSARPIKIPKVK